MDDEQELCPYCQQELDNDDEPTCPSCQPYYERDIVLADMTIAVNYLKDIDASLLMQRSSLVVSLADSFNLLLKKIQN